MSATATPPVKALSATVLRKRLASKMAQLTTITQEAAELHRQLEDALAAQAGAGNGNGGKHAGN